MSGESLITNEDRIRELADRVIHRLEERLAAMGRKGDLVVVFTAATVEFPEAIRQVRELILDGYCIRLAFSRAAVQLISKPVRDELAGFPYVGMVERERWLSSLKEARAVIVPMLSLNTLSKLSLLIADDLTTNLLLHALLMGKHVIMARNGADPADKGREELGFHKGNAALRQAMADRLKTVTDYGCILTDVRKLRDTLNSLLINEEIRVEKALEPAQVPFPSAPTIGISGRFVTAADIMHARRTGAELLVGPSSGLTPLARDLAGLHGVAVRMERNKPFNK